MAGAIIRSVALTGSDQTVRAASSVYRGITVRETGAGAATIRLFDHASAASGVLLETIALAQGESLSLAYPAGVWAENGIYADITGSVEGSVRYG
ncbi:hypothetical protein [Nonomuraea soli]|uniref:Uncharacterized protein n=1 Tax=Nonomuraea soli TaxID=1032476 RepID=A0A7W0CUC7_9ACTN|nr:hypothetical protein [Nonomuraea soli]MBA2897390.1 hypothetical protein [Nonomuraea soli]